jgi:hypothetical protein
MSVSCAEDEQSYGKVSFIHLLWAYCGLFSSPRICTVPPFLLLGNLGYDSGLPLAGISCQKPGSLRFHKEITRGSTWFRLVCSSSTKKLQGVQHGFDWYVAVGSCCRLWGIMTVLFWIRYWVTVCCMGVLSCSPVWGRELWRISYAKFE